MIQSQLRNGEKHHFFLLVLDFTSYTEPVPLIPAQATSCPAGKGWVSSYSQAMVDFRDTNFLTQRVMTRAGTTQCSSRARQK